MPSIHETLRTLRDVQGVYGSFVIAAAGGLVAHDLPAIFDAHVFAEVGPRVARLYETFSSTGDEMDACMLRFAEHKVYLRKMAWGIVGVVSGAAVNMPALRMVVNLVVRRIDPEVPPRPPEFAAMAPAVEAAGPAEGPSGVPSAREPADAPGVVAQDGRDSSPPITDRHVRIYRGRRVVDD